MSSTDSLARPSTAAAETSLCAHCALNAWCRPTPAKFPHRRRVAKGELLYRAGEPFESLYAVHAGFFKLRTTSVAADHVVGFQMAGELLGADGLGTGLYACDAIALEDSLVCVVPYQRAAQKMLADPSLQREFHGLLGRELDRRQQRAVLLAGEYSAEMRIAAFLGDLAQRLEALGYSGSSLNLRMTRQDIGSYLGLTLETVSRSLNRLDTCGLLRVCNRAVEIVDAAALRRLATTGTA